VTGFADHLRAKTRIFEKSFCVELRTFFAFVAVVALHSPPLRRQHFFKWEAVFLSALVYSECSALRFPNARSK
jgi:hypothetical protein